MTDTPPVVTAPVAAPITVNATPLSRVYSGDDPASPTMTVELQFPDEATAQATLSSLWQTPTQGPA